MASLSPIIQFHCLWLEASGCYTREYVQSPIMMTNDFDYSAQISFMDIRENLPAIDPEDVSAQQVVEILLYLMRQKVDFRDRGHEVNNKETAWINGYLLRLKPIIDDNGIQAYVVETMGSSMDKIALLK